jgi:RHS repeat-associated protein
VSGLSRTFDYDQRGRRWNDGDRQISYSWFDLPKRIDRGGTALATFEYDALHARVRKKSAGKETVTLGSLYERTAPSSSLEMATHLYRVPGPGRTVAEVQWDVSGTLPPDGERYLHSDRLGSIAMITGSGGTQLLGRNRFEPYGNAVDPSNPIHDGPPVLTGGTRRGFTGHEHDDELGLVNMNGRIYDPRSASFFSPDPVVAKPAWAHAFHPYSYVVNNPINAIDPTGFAPEEPADGGVRDAGVSGGVPGGEEEDFRVRNFLLDFQHGPLVQVQVIYKVVRKTDEAGSESTTAQYVSHNVSVVKTRAQRELDRAFERWTDWQKPLAQNAKMSYDRFQTYQFILNIAVMAMGMAPELALEQGLAQLAAGAAARRFALAEAAEGAEQGAQRLLWPSAAVEAEVEAAFTSGRVEAGTYVRADASRLSGSGPKAGTGDIWYHDNIKVGGVGPGGKSVELRTHSPNPTAPAGSYSRSNYTTQINTKDGRYLLPDGSWVKLWESTTTDAQRAAAHFPAGN